MSNRAFTSPPTFVVRAYPWFCGHRGLARTLAATIHDLRVPEINCSYQLFNVMWINANASSDLYVQPGLCIPHVCPVAHFPSSRGSTVPRQELSRQTYWSDDSFAIILIKLTMSDSWTIHRYSFGSNEFRSCSCVLLSNIISRVIVFSLSLNYTNDTVIDSFISLLNSS